ncbi:DUF2218 domain-containing protein [Hahella aquimaris]|uniref:DUF2218 domain-containing protein n=1 Tax=Hahella sp. HNIBRBA332 TaxID=3015983 RepID=UPI00273B53A1|nr:DUF2218 domain-containing protein [Hahella sp. HNIBRBA332]WLQ11985.1 DUF2218 domain-containing protein [Hahella sp. HNIBRBA332]
MLKSVATVPTDSASLYLNKLCKHFRHKVPAEWDDHEGRVQFKPGTCVMKADQATLEMVCEAENEEALGVVQYILDDHLVRFARKEDIQINWRRID